MTEPSQATILRRLEEAVDQLHQVVAEFQAYVGHNTNQEEGADHAD